jgi:hypothetical protein
MIIKKAARRLAAAPVLARQDEISMSARRADIQSLNSVGIPVGSIFKLGWDTSEFNQLEM